MLLLFKPRQPTCVFALRTPEVSDMGRSRVSGWHHLLKIEEVNKRWSVKGFKSSFISHHNLNSKYIFLLSPFLSTLKWMNWKIFLGILCCPWMLPRSSTWSRPHWRSWWVSCQSKKVNHKISYLSYASYIRIYTHHMYIYTTYIYIYECEYMMYIYMYIYYVWYKHNMFMHVYAYAYHMQIDMYIWLLYNTQILKIISFVTPPLAGHSTNRTAQSSQDNTLLRPASSWSNHRTCSNTTWITSIPCPALRQKSPSEDVGYITLFWFPVPRVQPATITVGSRSQKCSLIGTISKHRMLFTQFIQVSTGKISTVRLAPC